MFRPTRKSPLTLAIIAIFTLVLYYISETSKVEVKTPYYEEKLFASKEMFRALEAIRDYRIAKGIFSEALGDPLAVALVGQKYSMVTTEEGLLASKLTVLNPNFAGALVDMLVKARVKPDDKIAVAMTGSFPGLNLALFSACKALKIHPVIIISTGSSSWGANEEDFTWLDIETFLREKGIFDYKSVAASIGGGGDVGFGLSEKGRQLLRDSAIRNEVFLIEEKDLSSSVNKRMEIYGEVKQYKAFVNIGGGIAALGHPATGEIIETGFNYRLMPRNYPGIGVINHFGYEIPVIHLENIEKLRLLYDLPLSPNPLPSVGVGKVFIETKYDLRVILASLIVISLMLATLFRLDKQIFKFNEEGVEPDELL